MKPKFVFKPTLSKAKMFFEAMIAAMRPKESEESRGEFPTGWGWGSSGHEKIPHISEVAHLSKKERKRRRHIHRLSTRKK